LLIGNDIVVFGGFIDGFADATNQTFARDITNPAGVWRRMDDIPLADGLTHAAFVLVGTKVYTCGGFIGGHPGPHSPLCFVYNHAKNPGTGQWSRFADIPLEGTGGGGMVYDSNLNTIYYITGGQRLTPRKANIDDVDRSWKYSLDRSKGSWIRTTPLPYAANHVSFVSARDDKGAIRHFVFGGQFGENETLANLDYNYEWDANKEEWIPRRSMPFARGHAACSSVPVSCGFLVAGGAINGNIVTGKEATLDVSYYSIPTNEWTSIGNVTTFGRTPIAQVGNDGYMYFLFRDYISRRRGISY
jgi:Kelch motif